MTDYPLPAPPTTEQAAKRAWRIRHLYDERAMDRNAALFSLSLLYQQSASPHVRRLCTNIAAGIQPAPAAHG